MEEIIKNLLVKTCGIQLYINYIYQYDILNSGFKLKVDFKRDKFELKPKIIEIEELNLRNQIIYINKLISNNQYKDLIPSTKWNDLKIKLQKINKLMNKVICDKKYPIESEIRNLDETLKILPKICELYRGRLLSIIEMTVGPIKIKTRIF